MGYTYIDNILGQPIPQYVMNQLNIRSKKSIGMNNDGIEDGIRDNNALVYLANKSGWVRVISSVDIKGADEISSIKDNSSIEASAVGSLGSDLAKNYVLFGGTSAYKEAKKYELRNYTEGYQQDYGFRPIAGITSARISTQGKLGSILQAEIDFKANTKAQLDLVDILYFKLGYTMIVEWGSTFYYKQKNNPALGQLATDGELHRSEDYALQPFDAGATPEDLRIKIAQAIRTTEGNYDAMVGIVTNFSFTSNTDGGFDCKIRVLGPGMLAESMRTNSIQTLPKVYKDAVAKVASVVNVIRQTQATAEFNRIQKLSGGGGAQTTNVNKNDANIPDNYLACVKALIDAKKLFLGDSTNTGLIAAEAPKDDKLSGFIGYRFFINRRYQDPNTIGLHDYTCDKYNRVVDSADTTNILGVTGVQPLTENEIIDRIQKGTISTKYPNASILTGEFSAYSGKPDYKDVTFEDVEKNQYHAFVKIRKVVKSKKIDDIPVGEITAKVNITNEFLGIESPYDLKTVLTFFGSSKKNVLAKNTDTRDELMGIGSVNLGNSSFSYDDFDTQGIANRIEYTVFDIDYTRAAKLVSENTVRPSWNIRFQHRITTEDNISITDSRYIEYNRQSIGEKMYELISNPATEYSVRSIYAAIAKVTGKLPPTILEIKMPVDIQYEKTSVSTGKKAAVTEQKLILFQIILSDHSIITEVNQKSPVLDILPPTPPVTAAAPAVAAPTPEWTKVDVVQLQDTEAARYKSQIEGMLRTVQLSTISEFISAQGVIKDVNYIEWTKGKKLPQLVEIFEDGAFGSGVLQKLINEKTVLDTDPNAKKVVDILEKTKVDTYYDTKERRDKYLINAILGFNRNLMKDNIKLKEILAKPEYAVNFNETLRSYVIPYYQSKDLIDGGNIHYPSYITMGFFFMMLNHCGFLYDTTQKGLNIPITYLDFNPGSNLMLSSDFMMSANPYRFVVKFTGDVKSYKKLFDENILVKNKDEIIAEKEKGSTTPLWSGDAVSVHLPKFKFAEQGSGNMGAVAYRGRLMDVVVSIDYLLDVIKKHATRDETNTVYFRSLMDEILGDLGKALGNFNYFRLAYDDYSNTFYVTDDQNIPSNDSLYDDDTAYDLPLYGKKSIAKTFSVQTENSSKLGSVLAIGGNSEVKNQTTVGLDGTTYGSANLYAVDRYKKDLTGANDNEKNKKDLNEEEKRRRAQAAIRFNASVTAFFSGKSKSEEGVEQATNYYIDAVAKARNLGSNSEIKATVLLPLSANFSTDGVSGMGIYQSFTLPDQLLPYSYLPAAGGLGQNASKRVGFIITGLDHTIQNNVWTTEVKANMYYVKNRQQYDLEVRKQNQTAWNSILVTAGVGGVPSSISAPAIPTPAALLAIPIQKIGNMEFRDISDLSNYKQKGAPLKADKALVIHHTGGGGSAGDTMNTLNTRQLTDMAGNVTCSGGCLGVQWIIDRSGNIFRSLPAGSRGAHIEDANRWADSSTGLTGLNNANTQGVEVIASGDSSILPIQVEAAKKLVEALGYKPNQVVPHGEVNKGHKEPDEGRTICEAICPECVRNRKWLNA